LYKYPLLNDSGLPDPTAKQAMDKVLEEQNRYKSFIRIIKLIGEMCDFEILNRIEIKDRRTGVIFK